VGVSSPVLGDWMLLVRAMRVASFLVSGVGVGSAGPRFDGCGQDALDVRAGRLERRRWSEASVRPQGFGFASTVCAAT
jgi:hypothetical protein